MEIFYQEKNQEKDFAPSEKFSCYPPGYKPWTLLLLLLLYDEDSVANNLDLHYECIGSRH